MKSPVTDFFNGLLGLIPPKAFLYDQTNGLRYLDDLMTPHSGWTSFRSATGINNRGQVVGTGLIGGEIHIFLLTPIPEPSSLTMLLAALLPACLPRRTKFSRRF